MPGATDKSAPTPGRRDALAATLVRVEQDAHGGTDDGLAGGAAEGFAHTEQANRRRRDKAIALARYAWDRRIGADELAGFDDAVLRSFARAAGVHPPRSGDTWEAAVALLRRKERWADRNPDRPEVARAHPEERIMWIKPPVRGWR